MSTKNELERVTEIQSEEENNLPITALPVKMQRFVQLYMTGQYSLNKLAQLLEVHPNTLSNWLKRKDVKDIIEQMQMDIHDMVGIRLKALSLKASEKLDKLIDSPIDGVALQAVNSVLDRGGHRAKQEIKVDKTITTIEQKMKELIDSSIDVDFEEVIEENDENNE